MHRVILLIGGNEGDRFGNVELVKALIQERIGNIVGASGNYESEPWGFEHQLNFVNQVVEVETTMRPEEILMSGQEIEKELGRKAKTTRGYEGRTMDVDILFYDELILNKTDLIIPHPKLHERKFTLLPLVECWSELVHPKLKTTMAGLLSECGDEGWVRKVNE